MFKFPKICDICEGQMGLDHQCYQEDIEEDDDDDF